MIQDNNTLILHFLVLDENNDVTLFGEFEHMKKQLIYLAMELSDLDHIFMQLGPAGREMIEELADAIMHAKGYPLTVDVVDTLGLPLLVDLPGEMLWLHPEEDVYFYGS